jgi:hypothetical protein
VSELTDEALRLQVTQVTEMRDACVVAAPVTTPNPRTGQPETSWADGDEIACGYAPARGSETYSDGHAVTQIEGRLRVPLGTVIDHDYRVTITSRWGTVLTDPLVFLVLGPPLIGPSCIVVRLGRWGT